MRNYEHGPVGPPSREVIVDDECEDQATLTLQRGDFKCQGSGLLYRGFKCETPEDLKELLLPGRKSGCDPIQDRDRLKDWWIAQCKHYRVRIPANATAEVCRRFLKGEILERRLKRPQEFVELEKEMNEEHARRVVKSRIMLPNRKRLEYESESDGVRVTPMKRREVEDDTERSPKKSRTEVRPGRALTRARAQAQIVPRNIIGGVNTVALAPFTGVYELDCRSSSGEAIPRGPIALLVITMVSSHGETRFEAFLKLPTVVDAVLRLEPVGLDIDGDAVVRFAWCGRASWGGPNLRPSSSKIGSLKLSVDRRRVQGKIHHVIGGNDEHEDYLFTGQRDDQIEYEVEYTWQDFATRRLVQAVNLQLQHPDLTRKMNEALLHPIVISAIKCEPFECLGDGLLHDGVEREQPNTLKDLLAPTKTSKRTPIEDRERPKKWWKAQCAHYGIQVSSSAVISTYRAHLESAIRQRGGLKRPQNLADLEFEQNTKFRLLNAQVRDATTNGSQAKSSKSKTKATNPTQVPVSEPPAKTKPKATTEPKPKPDPKPKTESKEKAKEPKAKPEAKTKARAKPSATTDPAPKATATKKRKADTVVHVYHYDGGKATPALPTQNMETEVVHRPTKKARTTASSASAGTSAHSSGRSGAPVPGLPPSYSQIFPRPKQAAASNPFSQMNGKYELTCSSEEKRGHPSGFQATLSVEISERRDSWFTGVLELPGIMACALRLKPGLSCPNDGYVRFEWCGYDDAEDHIIPPDQYYVGWLKLNEAARQVKGMITGYCGEFTFSGHRIGPTSRVFPEYKWDEFTMDSAYEEEEMW